MKNVILSIKTMTRLFIAPLLLFVMNANGQTTINTPADLSQGGDYLKGTSTSTGTTLLCSGATFKLSSSTTDPNNSSIAYTSYDWKEIETDGSTIISIPNNSAVAGAPNKVQIAGASPGWHTYRVVASTSATGCVSDPTYFTVYVLPDLNVTAKANQPDDASLTFCALTGAPGGANQIVFNGTSAFAATPRIITGGGFQLPALTVDNFAKTYKWTKTDEANVVTDLATNSATYTVNDAASAGAGTIKKYTYKFEAKYAAQANCGPYSTTAVHSGDNTTATVTVTPKPGKPTINIE